MAKAINNPVMQGVSGKVGKVVFRRTVFGTVVAKLPDYSIKRKLTPAQKAFRIRFKRAAAYVKLKLENPLFGQKYEGLMKPGHTTYITAFTDYMSPPEIHSINILVISKILLWFLQQIISRLNL